MSSDGVELAIVCSLTQALKLAVLGAALVLLGSCGDCGLPGSPAGGAQHLVFTGPAAGTLTTATTECHIFTASTQLNVLLAGKLGGQDLTFNIQVNSGYKGPGQYSVGSILDSGSNLRLQVGSYAGSSTGGEGTLTVNDDEKSGSIDADLSGGEHVKGTYRCAEIKTE